MFKIINDENIKLWDSIVCSFNEYDVYYLNGYVKSFQLHGDGKPVLLYYESESLRGISAMMMRDISNDKEFNSVLESGRYYDLITPYGYGGFIFEGNFTDSEESIFKQEYFNFLKDNHIVSAFFRFHPKLENANYMRNIVNVIDLGETIDMDLSSSEVIWTNIISKNRNVIRKAQKFGVEIKHGKGISYLNQFIDIYNATMDKDNANPYYYFNKEFYQSIDDDLNENYEVFYAEYEGNIISMSIIIFANNKMHYHLSGSIQEYRNLASSNLLLYKAAEWGATQGFKTFHMGGGLGSGEDNLFKFKQAFNRNSDNQFSIGKQISNTEIYNKLVSIRKENDESFDESSSFFPLYRS